MDSYKMMKMKQVERKIFGTPKAQKSRVAKNDTGWQYTRLISLLDTVEGLYDEYTNLPDEEYEWNEKESALFSEIDELIGALESKLDEYIDLLTELTR